ncbi:MAG: sigma-70 family RNA polymerase sigma factor [Chloroflexi bacterium]|nr:sigma-70 family RNA polymerase sigma factor [Chloroflexota bacterium]
MYQRSDEVLLQLIVQRDALALEALYDRYAQTIYNLIVHIVQNPAIADELLQETFWQVWQACEQGQFRGEGAAAAWLCRIARNKSLDQLRRQKARPRPVETKSDEDEESLWSQFMADVEVERLTERSWDRQYLRQALDRIPSEQRLCLELAYFEGMSQRQIAEYTDTPLGTIKTRLRMGLEKLERILRVAGYQAEDIY